MRRIFGLSLAGISAAGRNPRQKSCRNQQCKVAVPFIRFHLFT
jgi:hypothetical protein